MRSRHFEVDPYNRNQRQKKIFLEPGVELKREEEEVIEKFLPSAWEYEIFHCYDFKRDTPTAFHVALRVNFTCAEDGLTWLEQFKTLTGVALNIHVTIHPNTYLLRKDFVCQRSKHGQNSMLKWAEVKHMQTF